jgi:hypothetical protein
MEDAGGNNTGDCTIYYQTGNGTGISWSEKIDKNTTIELPNEKELKPADGTAVFVGWSDEDGMLTYPAGYEYTVTKNVTFKARWAFDAVEEDALVKIKTYLAAEYAPLIAVAGGVAPGDSDITSLTWENLLSVIKNAEKEVELDLSGSTLALFGTGFDYKDGQQNAKGYETGEKYIKKLILPRAARSITSVFKEGPFSKLEAVSGLNVSAIPTDAFRGTPTLTAVAFPAAVTIGINAFNLCPRLASVSLPVATTIGWAAFYSCPSLIEVSLPAVETIDTQAFYGCTSLTSVSLPAAETIYSEAFYGCPSLNSVSLPAAETIAAQAFYGCTSLNSVSLPAAKSIGVNAFQSCTSLTSVSLPAAETIDTQAFYGCTNLNSVSLPAAVTIYSEAFYACTSLNSVSLPAAVTIYSGAFYECTGLTSVSLPAAVTINTEAFYRCDSLNSVSLPAAKSIGVNAFQSCTSLTSVSLPAAEIINDSAFASCDSLNSVSLPAAKSIGDSAFLNCSLTRITIAANCEINTNSKMPNGFIVRYEIAGSKGGNKLAGMYTENNSGSWSYTAL